MIIKDPIIDVIFDGNEKIEISSSHPTVGEAVKSLHSDPRY